MKYVSICALLGLYHQLYRTDDKKLMKTVWEVYKKVCVNTIGWSKQILYDLYIQVPIVYLCGNVCWTASQFFSDKFPSLIRLLDKKALQTVEQHRLAYLQAKEASLAK